MLVPGFEPHAGNVATMVSGDRHRGARSGRPPRVQGRPERHEDRPAPLDRPQHSQARPQHRPAPSKHSDPIFSKPYEPGTAPLEAKPQEPAPAHAKRRERPVAALLGGLKR